jgi:hypothetical protein
MGPAEVERLVGVPTEAFDRIVLQLSGDLDVWLHENTEPFAPGAPTRVLSWLQTMVMDTSGARS